MKHTATLVLLLALSTGVSAQLFAPTKPIANRCETAEPIFSAKRVFVDVVLFKFCDLDRDVQAKYMERKAHLHRVLFSYGSYLRESFGWDVKMTLRSIGACDGPFKDSKIMDYAIAKPVKDQVTLLMSIVYKPDFQGSALARVDYGQWASDVKSNIRAVLTKNKATSMVTFVLHQYEKHHMPSTETVYHSLNDLVILPNDHYHLEVIPDAEYRYGNMADAKFRTVLKVAFACNPAYIGGTPYQFTDAAGKYNCQCRCPIGEHFKRIGTSELHRCVKDQQNNSPRNKCGRLARCYVFSASELPGESLRSCRLKVFEKARLPCPWDNYVAWHRNPAALSALAPRITCRLNAIGTTYATTQTFSWAELRNTEKTFAQLLDEKFTITKAGIYHMEVSAHDFNDLESCKTEIRITDNVVPSTSVACPSGDNPANPIPHYQASALRPISAFLNAFKAYKKKAMYGKCENGEIKSKLGFTVRCLDDATCFRSYSADVIHLKKQPSDQAYLESISKSILTDPPGAPQKKCLSGRGKLMESTTIRRCDAASSERVLAADACSATRCYELSGKALYKSTIEINPRTQAATLKLMSTLVPGFNAEKSEIHERIVDAKLTRVTRDLSDYVDIDLDGTAFGIGHFDSNRDDPNLQSIINCRYKVPEASIGDYWQKWHWNDKNQVELTQETNQVQIQCWTKIGMVALQSFKLVIHPTAKLDVCEAFSDASFYQSVTLRSAENAESEYCNVKGSDFGELTFHFNNWVGRGRDSHQESQYFFYNIQCLAAYDHGDDKVEDFSGTPAAVIKPTRPQKELTNGQPEPPYKLIKRFGINLKTSLTTAKKTRVRFECRIAYRDRTVTNVKDPKAIVHVDCPHTVTFRDCDKPMFPVNEPRPGEGKAKDCEDVEKCYAACGETKIKPFQYCGPNQLSFVQTASVTGGATTTIDDVGGKKRCCSDAKCTEYYGSTFTCKSIGPDEDDDLKRCEPQHPTIAALLQTARANPMAASSAFFGAIIVMALFARRLRRPAVAKPAVELANRSVYAPLL